MIIRNRLAESTIRSVSEQIFYCVHFGSILSVRDPQSLGDPMFDLEQDAAQAIRAILDEETWWTT